MVRTVTPANGSKVVKIELRYQSRYPASPLVNSKLEFGFNQSEVRINRLVSKFVICHKQSSLRSRNGSKSFPFNQQLLRNHREQCLRFHKSG